MSQQGVKPSTASTSRQRSKPLHAQRPRPALTWLITPRWCASGGVLSPMLAALAVTC